MSKSSENEIEEFIENFRISTRDSAGGDLIKDLCLESGPNDILQKVIFNKFSIPTPPVDNMEDLERQLLSQDEDEEEEESFSDVCKDNDYDDEDDDDDDDFMNQMKEDVMGGDLLEKDIEQQSKFGAKTARSHGDVLMLNNIHIPEEEVTSKIHTFDVDAYEKIVAERVFRRIIPQMYQSRDKGKRKAIDSKNSNKLKSEESKEVPRVKRAYKKRKTVDLEIFAKGRYVPKYYSDSESDE